MENHEKPWKNMVFLAFRGRFGAFPSRFAGFFQRSGPFFDVDLVGVAVEDLLSVSDLEHTSHVLHLLTRRVLEEMTPWEPEKIMQYIIINYILG